MIELKTNEFQTAVEEIKKKISEKQNEKRNLESQKSKLEFSIRSLQDDVDKLQEEFGNNIYFKYAPDDLACTEGGSSETTFEEYINEESSHVYISVAVPYEVENKEAVNNLLQNIFSDIALSGDIYFFDAETDIDADITEKIETKQYSEKVYISKAENEEKYQFEWSSETRS
jgi:hypothetical protein